MQASNITINPSLMMAKQIPLAIPTIEDCGFVLGEANRLAHDYLSRAVWAFPVAALTGPAGSGKSTIASHLGFRVVDQSDIGDILLTGAAGDFAIDDLSQFVRRDGAQETLFHFYNYITNGGGRLVLIDEAAPSQLNYTVQDLKTRLSSVEVVKINDPDDNLIRQLLVKDFHLRGVTISSDVVEYLLRQLQRDYQVIAHSVETIERAAQIDKSRINVRFVKSVLDTM